MQGTLNSNFLTSNIAILKITIKVKSEPSLSIDAHRTLLPSVLDNNVHVISFLNDSICVS